MTPEITLKHCIGEIYTAHLYYSYQRITAQLRRVGQQVNYKAVAQYMREMSIVAVHPGPNLSKRAQQAAIFSLQHTLALPFWLS
jgi:putative transposase